MAMAKKARSEKYVDKILINWEANGYPVSREEQVQGAKNSKAKTPAKGMTAKDKKSIIDNVLGGSNGNE
jgi:DNA replication protein DnaD